MESTETYKRPSRRIAAALGFFIPPAGMLYVARPGRAAIYLALLIAIAAVDFVVLGQGNLYASGAALLVAIVCAVQAFRLARDFREVRRPWYSHGFGLPVVIAAFVAVPIGIRACLVEPFRAVSGSMLPSIQPGARLIGKKWGYGNYAAYGIHFARTPISSEVSRGDIFVFEFPEDRKVKYVHRIVGLPGDRIAYFSKRLWVNDQEAPRKQVTDYLNRQPPQRLLQYLERLDGGEYPILIDPDAPASVPFTRPFPLKEGCTYT